MLDFGARKGHVLNTTITQIHVKNFIARAVLTKLSNTKLFTRNGRRGNSYLVSPACHCAYSNVSINSRHNTHESYIIPKTEC